MIANRKKKYDPTRCSFKKLCELVTDYSYPYEDLAELIEDKGYEECMGGNDKEVIQELGRLSTFFENIENKNEENSRDLADVYLLTGEFCQCSDRIPESIAWFEKAIVVDDTYDVPYHSLATAYISLGKMNKAAQCLEQEITVAPGNYFSYLMLADLYEQRKKDDKVEDVLRNLLARDSNNIQALHKLITFYESRNPELDMELLRRRLINADKELIKLDLVIWTYHMCCDGRYEEALNFLNKREAESPEISLTHLLKGHIYGCMKQYVNKRNELEKFKKLNHRREEFMRSKLDEFCKVFGEKACTDMKKKMAVTKLTSR